MKNILWCYLGKQYYTHKLNSNKYKKKNILVTKNHFYATFKSKERLKYINGDIVAECKIEKIRRAFKSKSI